MILPIIVFLIIILIFAHGIYVAYDEYNPVGEELEDELNNPNSLSDYFINKKEGWTSRPYRDIHEGSYADPLNAKGSLGREAPTGDFSTREEAINSINKILQATDKFPSTNDMAEMSETRTPNQVFIFHDDLEGVKATNKKTKTGRVAMPNEFLDRLDTDGYKSDNAYDNTWSSRLILPDTDYYSNTRQFLRSSPPK